MTAKEAIYPCMHVSMSKVALERVGQNESQHQINITNRGMRVDAKVLDPPDHFVSHIDQSLKNFPKIEK
ncbi:hypothetical protein ACJX0J_009916, partial [Zea mays]